MFALISIVLVAGIVIALYGIFQKSEHDEALPVAPPTIDDLEKGNISPDVPRIDD